MNIYFEDWSMFLPTLEGKGIRHGNRIIKAFATDKDVRLEARRDRVMVISSDDSPFREDEEFSYEGRKAYSGRQLEQDLSRLGLSELGQRTVRALFRFSYGMGFNQVAMAEPHGDGWLINHPFDDIDGVGFAIREPERRSTGLHLDIFFPESLIGLGNILGVDQEALVDLMREGRRIRETSAPHMAKERVI